MGKFPLKLVFRTTPYHLLTCYSTLALCTTAQSPSFRLSLNAPTFSTFAPSWPLSHRTAQHYQEPGRICVWCLEPREEVVLNFPPDLTDDGNDGDDEDDKARLVLVDRWCCYSVQMSPGSTWQKFTVCNIKGYVLLSGTLIGMGQLCYFSIKIKIFFVIIWRRRNSLGHVVYWSDSDMWFKCMSVRDNWRLFGNIRLFLSL